jgi:hypothetical protein
LVWFLKSKTHKKICPHKWFTNYQQLSRKYNLPFLAASRKNICKEPDELVARRTSGRSIDGPNESE